MKSAIVYGVLGGNTLHLSTDITNAYIYIYVYTPSPFPPLWSCCFRYEDEFREISRLGKGGFGTVYRCRNRLDDSEYAIKKLRLSSDERWSGRMEKVLREVKILAFLDHPHIVRYFHAWLERHDWAGKSLY
jgi:serine/threonine protein kinase